MGLTGVGILDVTHPEGEDYIAKVFSYLYELGFRYFKLDFLGYVENVCQFYRRAEGTIWIIRHLLKIVRRSTKDSYILGCGCPPEAGIGLCDGMRIGGDISNFFPTVRINSQYIAMRHWMHNRFFINDPDFLIVRGKVTSKDTIFNPYLPSKPYKYFTHRSGEVFSHSSESKCWATMVLLSGGPVALSDRISTLNSEGISRKEKFDRAGRI